METVRRSIRMDKEFFMIVEQYCKDHHMTFRDAVLACLRDALVMAGYMGKGIGE